jgi:hypothetical protein
MLGEGARVIEILEHVVRSRDGSGGVANDDGTGNVEELNSVVPIANVSGSVVDVAMDGAVAGPTEVDCSVGEREDCGGIADELAEWEPEPNTPSDGEEREESGDDEGDHVLVGDLLGDALSGGRRSGEAKGRLKLVEVEEVANAVVGS